MLVYRVAKNGYGPYQYPNKKKIKSQTNKYRRLQNDLCRDHNVFTTHPSVGLYMKEKDFCGFDSLDSLKKWFNGYLNRLHRLGFKVFVYEKRVYRIKEGQIIFRKSKIKQTLSLKEI